MLPAPVPPGLVLGECSATSLPTQGLHAHKQRQEICPRKGSPLAIYFSFHFGSLGAGEKWKGERERNQVTRAAQCLQVPCKSDLHQMGAGTKDR